MATLFVQLNDLILIYFEKLCNIGSDNKYLNE